MTRWVRQTQVGEGLSPSPSPEIKIKITNFMKKYARKYNTPEYRKRYTGIYGSWYAIKQRCDNSNHSQFQDYGGRGISYPKKWISFQGFKEDMQDGHKKGLTIDRIDNNKSYSKENCKWATRQEQNENKRSNIILKYAGQKKSLIEWCKIFNLPHKTLRYRFYRGWDVERILETPPHGK